MPKKAARPTRFVFICHAPFELGGVQTFLVNFAREATSRGTQVWIASTMSRTGPLRSAFDSSSVGLLDWTGVTQAFYGKTDGVPEVCRRVLSDLALIRPQAMWLNDCVSFGLGCVPLLGRLRPMCHVFDGLRTFQSQATYITDRLPYFQYLDGVACVDPSLVDRFRQLAPQSHKTLVQFIPNGVLRSHISRNPNRARALRVTYVGRLVAKQKRVHDLPRIFRVLNDRGIDFRLTLVGDGPDRDTLAAEFRRLGLADLVQFTGFLPPDLVIKHYPEQDVIINVSDYEGRSSSLVEGMAAGCVPVCSDIASSCALLRNARSGVICPVGNVDAFARALASLAAQDLASMRSAAMVAVADLTVDRMFDRYVEFYERACQRRPIESWPDNSEEMWGTLWNGWNVSKHNPWLAQCNE